jgi:signal transduction histidine kinase
VLFTPARIFTHFNPLYQIITTILILFVVRAFILACARKHPGALLITITGVFLVITAINDILFLSIPFNDYDMTFLRHIIRTGNLSSSGLIVFIFAQSIVLAMNTSKAFFQVEEMSEKLKIADKQKDELLASLEAKVKERTLELEESNKRLKNAYQNLSLVENSRKRLLTNISHDFKTPITLIQGYIEAIVDGIIGNKDEQIKYLNLIHNKIISLTQMTNELFELSQLESRQTKLNLQKVSISNLMAKVESKYGYDVRSAGLDFKVDLLDSLSGFVNIDVNQIYRVFSNLIFNAIKFTREGSIILSCRLSQDNAIFEISDTGLGISNDDLPFIFDRFYIASKSRNSSLKSSGLGLAIAKEIIEYHGGSIWADSKHGCGSSFYFTIRLENL